MSQFMVTSYRDTVAASARNPNAKWPDRSLNNRLEPFAQPSFDTGLELEAGAKVMTMGSCFARNIEEYFAGEGFNMPVITYDAPKEEYSESGRIQGILNKYTLASIAEEIEWLAKVKNEGGKVTWENIEPMMLELGEDKILDLQLSTDATVSKARAIERRQQIYDIHVQIFDCDVVILTPGLTETWIDQKTGLHIQRTPRPRKDGKDAGRFAFEVMDFFQCFEMLERTVKTLKDNGTTKIAMTVSPVPLIRTMTDKDVLIANTYSKATLRSVIGLICDRYDVYYIPSFEMVTLSNNEAIWRDDLRHLTNEFIGQIASTFAASTGAALKQTSSQLRSFNAALAAGDTELAASVLDGMGAEAVNVGVYGFHKNAGQLLMKAKRWEEALPHARQLQALRPRKGNAYNMEYRIHKKMGNQAGVDATVERVVRNVDNISREEFLGAVEAG
jgi:hypothetical protein